MRAKSRHPTIATARYQGEQIAAGNTPGEEEGKERGP